MENNRWKILKEIQPKILKNNKKLKVVECQCECGTIRNVIFNSIKYGLSKSCGCLHKEIVSNNKIQHNQSKKNYYLYTTWKGMKDRCLRKNNKSYKNYGGRGIKIYEPWINNFELFRDYILQNLGERPINHSLDRIINDGNYEPNNLRWATSKMQRKNQR